MSSFKSLIPILLTFSLPLTTLAAPSLPTTLHPRQQTNTNGEMLFLTTCYNKHGAANAGFYSEVDYYLNGRQDGELNHKVPDSRGAAEGNKAGSTNWEGQNVCTTLPAGGPYGGNLVCTTIEGNAYSQLPGSYVGYATSNQHSWGCYKSNDALLYNDPDPNGPTCDIVYTCIGNAPAACSS